jgi:hypothetical protein
MEFNMPILLNSGQGKNLFFKNILKRHLYDFQIPKDEVAIGNNSLLFFIYASIRIHGRHVHPRLSLVIPEFWLDKTHSDYNSLSWGQTPRGLPWYLRREFSQLFPKHEHKDLISWGQFKDLRAHTIQELAKHATIYHGVPKIVKTRLKYEISVNNKLFFVPTTTFFYNSWRSPNLNHGLSGLPSKLQAHYKLYQYSENNVPEQICIIGSGHTITQFANTFPNTIIHCITQDNSLPLLKNEKAPDNINYYRLENFAPHGKKYHFATKNSYLDDGLYATIINIATNSIIFDGMVFCSLGMHHNPNITLDVDQDHVLNYPYDPCYFNWVGTEETPLGDLTEATIRWASATNNLDWAYELYCYHDEPFANMLTKKLGLAGIEVTPLFFEILKENLLKLTEKNFYQTPIHAGSQQVILEVYKRSYAQAYGHNTINTAIIKKFETALRDSENKRLNRYINNNYLSKTP